MPSGIFLCGIRLKPVHARQHCLRVPSVASCVQSYISVNSANDRICSLQLNMVDFRLQTWNHVMIMRYIFSQEKKLQCTETTKVVWTRSIINEPYPSWTFSQVFIHSVNNYKKFQLQGIQRDQWCLPIPVKPSVHANRTTQKSQRNLQIPVSWWINKWRNYDKFQYFNQNSRNIYITDMSLLKPITEIAEYWVAP